MKGIWQGQYWYNNHKMLTEIIKNRKTNFKLHITHFDKNNFSGTVEDDLVTGGTPGIGTIEGILKGNQILFIKKMPVKSIMYPDGGLKNLRGKHPNIYYSGILNKETQTMNGSWKFKFSIYWFLLIPIPLRPLKGEWSSIKQS